MSAAGVEDRHRSLGLSDEEAEAIADLLGRPPNDLELALFAVMWSEHCSYKSSRRHLRRLPTEGPGVLVGPGENAGVISAGDTIAVAVRIESHNHPSAVEPHQGAATGVGGILRDVFTMGARPLALMDPLFFGPPDDPRQRWLFEGVVGGIAAYGNAVGVPTVGGELTFDAAYSANPLVNVLCLGALPEGRLVLARASRPGDLAVLLGAATGRDGIGGVSVLASAGFDDAQAAEASAKRPSVQVGDPFEEKRLIEACLALLDAGALTGLQDLGGAGLACATSETATRGGTGMDVDVDAVVRREPAMSPIEVMTSESQERMLALVHPERLAEVEEVCRRFEVRSAVIGQVTDTGRLTVRAGGEVVADVPASALTEGAPLYDRPRAEPTPPSGDPDEAWRPGDVEEDLLALLVDPQAVFSQYDHQLFLNTVEGPGGDAALLRLAGPGLPRSERGLGLTTDANPRACALSPRQGAALVVAEAVLNLACVGARPAALVNCLNFGNPEHPEVMWQLSEAVDGLAEACGHVGVPVVGGNVSLYNESAGTDIPPTPVVGLVGLVERLRARPPGARLVEGAAVVLLGERRAPAGWPAHPLAASRLAVERLGLRGGRLAPLDWAAHERLAHLVTSLVAAQVAGHDGPVAGVHDISAGGLGVAVAEMALRGQVGARLEGIEPAELFSELAPRVLVATFDPDQLEELASSRGVPVARLGVAGGPRLVVEGLVDVGLERLAEAARRHDRGG